MPRPPPPARRRQVEVRKGKFSERDYRLAQELNQQEQAIERERRNLKTTETDRALNDAQVSRTLSIFGGNSAAFRQRVASERVELLEAEKDIIEQIAIAQQPEEKKALQRQLDELRAMRRQLDQSLR
jgi:predicted aminopeptidase